MNYTIRLADGTELTGLTKNGNNYVSENKIDESIFENNLTEMVVSDGETETTYHYVELIQQVKYSDGWYLLFRELSKQEIREKTLKAKLEYLAMMTDVNIDFSEGV